MRLEIPTLLFDIIDGFGFFGRQYYKNKYLNAFESYNNFKKFVKYDEIRKKNKAQFNKEKYFKYFCLGKDNDVDLHFIYTHLSEEQLKKIYNNEHQIYLNSKKNDLQFYTMKKYRHHTSYTGYHINMWRKGSYYFEKNMSSFANRLFYIMQNEIRNGSKKRIFENDYFYYTVVFYPSWIGYEEREYNYISESESYEPGEIVFVDNGATVQIREKIYTPYKPYGEGQIIRRANVIEEATAREAVIKNLEIKNKKEQEQKKYQEFLDSQIIICQDENDEYFIVNDTLIKNGDYIINDNNTAVEVKNIISCKGYDANWYVTNDKYIAKKISTICTVEYYSGSKLYNYFIDENLNAKKGDIVIAPNGSKVTIVSIININKNQDIKNNLGNRKIIQEKVKE